MNYNNDVLLWENYAASLRQTMPNGGARHMIHEGAIHDGMRFKAQFDTSADARQCLLDAGWREIEPGVFKP